MAAASANKEHDHQMKPKPDLLRSISKEEYLFEGQPMTSKCNQNETPLKMSDSSCDVTIKVEHLVMNVHRDVIKMLSPYFKAMLESDMKESTANIIKLEKADEIDAESTRKIIQYAYTGQLLITGETVQSLLMTATFFQVGVICNACSAYITAHLDLDNVMPVMQFASHMGLDNTLGADAFKYILVKFGPFSKTENFLKISPDMLMAILKAEETSAIFPGVIPYPSNQEKAITDATVSWVKYSNQSRVRYLPELLQFLHLPMLTVATLKTLRKRSVIQQASVGDIVDKAINVCKSGEDSDVTDIPSRWYRPRKCSLAIYKSDIFAGGGYETCMLTDFIDHDDEAATNVYVTAIKVWSRAWNGSTDVKIIAGVAIHYSNGQIIQHGEPTRWGASREQMFGTHDDGDVITSVDVRSGWVIDSLQFHTSSGRSSAHCGGHGGTQHVTRHAAYHRDRSHGYLSSVRGSVVHSQGGSALTNLQFIWTNTVNTVV